MKITKYVPVWKITFQDKTYEPAASGAEMKTIEGLPDDEIARLLKMGAIKKMKFDDGKPDSADPPDDGDLDDGDNDDPDGDEDTGDDDDTSAPVGKRLEDMTFAELKAIAKEQGIPTPVGTSTEQLRTTLIGIRDSGSDE